MNNDLFKFKFAALYSKKYGHIANVLTTGKHDLMGFSSIPEDAADYNALEFPGMISGYLIGILKDDAAVNDTQDITDFLSSLSEFNDDFPEMDVTEDIEMILMIEGALNGNLHLYSYVNTSEGFSYRPAKIFDVGVKLNAIIEAARPHNRFKEYGDVLLEIYQAVEEIYNNQNGNNLPSLQEYNQDLIPAIFPNSNFSRITMNEITPIGEPQTVPVSKKGKGANESFYFGIANQDITTGIEEIDDDIEKTLDHFKERGINLTPLERIIYASLCGFANAGYSRFSLIDLACHCYQKSSESIRKMPEEKLRSVFNGINRLRHIETYVYFDSVQETYHLTQEELINHGVKRDQTGYFLAGHLIDANWFIPLNGDLSGVYINLLSMPLLANHDMMINQVQYIPPRMLKARGKLHPDKVGITEVLDRLISNQMNMLKKSKNEITKKELQKKEYSRFTTVNINKLLVQSGLAEWDPLRPGRIILNGVKKQYQRIKRKRMIDEPIKYLSEQLRAGIIKSFEVIRENGSKETYCLGSDSWVETTQSRGFKKNKQITQLKVFCVD